MRRVRRLPWAGHAGRRLNDKESLMVHLGRPTTPAMAQQHKLQPALTARDGQERVGTPSGNGRVQLAARLIDRCMPESSRVRDLIRR